MQFDIETKGGFTLPAAGQTSVAFLCYYDNENTKRFCTSILNLQEGWVYRRFPHPFGPEVPVKSASVFFLSGIKVFSFLRSSSFFLRYSLSCHDRRTSVWRPPYKPYHSRRITTLCSYLSGPLAALNAAICSKKSSGSPL